MVDSYYKSQLVLEFCARLLDSNNTHQNFELSLYFVFVNVFYSILLTLVFYYILILLSSLTCLRCFLQYEGETLAIDVGDAAPPSTDPASVASVSDKILLQLQQLGGKMDSTDRRVQRTEASLGQGFQQASSSSTCHNPSIQNCESHGINMEETIDSVVPSLGYLRNNT